MKKALVISLFLVAGLGLAGFAGPLSGSWCVSASLDYIQSGATNILTMPAFDTTLELDYTVCGWTFSSTAEFTKHQFDNLYFEADGSVGAFGFYGVLDFVPYVPAFKYVAGAADLSIAGVSVYAIGVLWNFGYTTTNPVVKSGFAVGGYGNAGDCTIHVEAQFCLASSMYYLYWYGYDSVVDYLLDYDVCGVKTEEPAVQSPCCGTLDCCTAWTGLDIWVDYSFACFDLLTMVNFDCEVGFDQVCFEIDDLCIGIDWLIIDYVDICFNIQTKTVTWDVDLVIGDCFCITPYVRLGAEPTDSVTNAVYTLDSIVLYGLTVDWDMGQGVTFKAGELFDLTSYTFTSAGAISRIGTAFMDWAHTDVDLDIGIGSNTTLSFGFDLVAAGLEDFYLGVCFEF